ncbi:hypothetical protein CIK99_11190 [Prevotella sp. P5-92]|nr:hypothetical protein CIK99_11190 [Prevotella sp. P5-92]
MRLKIVFFLSHFLLKPIFLAPIWPQKKNTNINHPSKIYLSGLPIIKTDINFDPQATHNRRLEGYIKKMLTARIK